MDSVLSAGYIYSAGLAFVIVVSYAAFTISSRRSAASVAMSTSFMSAPIKDHLSVKLKGKVASVLDQLPLKQKLSLQTRVANAMTAADLLQIFADYRELERLRLSTEKITSDELLSQANEQAFKDLVRERVMINEVAIEPMQHAEKDFRQKFQAHIQETISKHVKDLTMRDLIATHICCHLSRTRAGGDSFFAIQDIFATPQFTITAAAAYTHPPTSLLVTTDGWAVITTTSNFDVYCKEAFSREDDEHPEALVTISALVEEAVPLSLTAKEAWVKFVEVNGIKPDPSDKMEGDVKHAAALPVSRTLRLTCTLPVPSMYYGYIEKSFGIGDNTQYGSPGGRDSPLSSNAGRPGDDTRGPRISDPASSGGAYMRHPSPSNLPKNKDGVIFQKSIASLRENNAIKRISPE